MGPDWFQRSLRWCGVVAAWVALLGAVTMTHGDQPDPHNALQNPDGSWKYTNALAGESSLYLRQHMHNPVDWHPWGHEAFELARAANKPIFLSIGYATCYWCHVMERQVFENPTLAAAVNQRFICIKVDREERPEIDDIYMTAVQLLSGRGGWPMSVFLTPPGADGPDDPGLKPFWAATYIPPQPAHGMPGFGQVVEALSQAWNEKRNQVLAQAQQTADAITSHLSQKAAQPPADPAPQIVQSAANQMVQTYDPVHGGFGSAPKFPQPGNLLFLMRVHRNNPNPQLWKALANTLERMARGGMYDQAGGGFHRYSTDERWLVPHFEKMLYDNAQLIEAYVYAHETHPDPADPQLYERVIRETCDYILREMTVPSHATASSAPGTTPQETSGREGDDEPRDLFFCAAQDAEVDGREGLNYLWTKPEIRQAIGDDALADWAIRLYGLDEGTNFQDPHHPDDPPANVLFLPLRLDELARADGIKLDEVVKQRSVMNVQLLAARAQRKQPVTDDKVITSWNGMMIAAMAMAGRSLNEPRYTAAAQRAAESIITHPADPQAGLYRTLNPHLLNGSQHDSEQLRGAIPGGVEDYAYFVHGLLELYRATGRQKWLDQAVEFTHQARQNFSAQDHRGGGYFDTLPGRDDLFVRAVSVYDGAIPTGNSQMIHNLLDLYELTNNAEYFDQAATDLKSFLGSLSQLGQAMAHMQHALLRALEIDPNRFAIVPAPASSPTDPQDDASGGGGGGQPAQRKVIRVAVDPEAVDLSSGPATVTVTLDVGPDYHLNAHQPGIKDLIPTQLQLTGAQGLTLDVDYPQGQLKRYPFADHAFRVYEGKTTITATIRKQTNPQPAAPAPHDHPSSADAPAAPKLTLTYQICTDQSCLEPRRVELPLTITGLDPQP